MTTALDEKLAALPAVEVLDALYEAANDSRRSGHTSALKLLTAHGAKGLEFRHIIVMDCPDWRWSGEDERRLLYVAMTRAIETLTVMRAEGGRNPRPRKWPCLPASILPLST